jgi:flavin reductase (DIM6/NTAB) family NADH-FMN oxidoreductase RutF
MVIFKKQQIEELDNLFRANLINSCSGYKSANLIATRSAEGVSNVAIFSSVIHLGSDPALLGFILRPATVIRNTYENIKKTNYYTINHIHQEILSDAHHTSAKYGQEISEFEMTNLSETVIDNFFAPFVGSAPVKIGMKFLEEYVINANQTILVVGEIQNIYMDEGLMETDGFVNLSKGRIAAINGLNGYAIPDLKVRLDYQRPKISVSQVS